MTDAHSGAASEIQRGRSAIGRFADFVFVRTSTFFALAAVVLIGWIGLRLFSDSAITRHQFGWSMLTRTDWDISHGVYGAATFIFGTLASSAVALVIAIPVGLGAALFLTEVAPKWLATPIAFVIELLAAVPSIIYGLWGFVTLCPLLQSHLSPWLEAKLGANPLFGGPPMLTNVLAAGLLLAIMVLPFITSISREVIKVVPTVMREGSLALGSTRWETVKNVVLPASRAGIVGACILALGRALGETMAVIMVIGNNPQIKASLLQPAYSMAGKIANEFAEASNDRLQRSALIEIALILFVITLIANALATLMIGAAETDAKGPGLRAPWVVRAQRSASSFVAFAGTYGWRGIACGFVAFQVYSDWRHYGGAALFRGFELWMIGLAGVAGLLRWVRLPATGMRRGVDAGVWCVCSICGFLACLVLGAVIFHVTVRGIKGLDLTFFTEVPKAVGEAGGGMKHAIIGTVMLVAIASAVGIPAGIFAGVYVAELSHGALGRLTRFSANVLNGIPTVIIGLFAYAAFVLPFGHFSAWAGSLALAVIMIPTIARTTEDVMRLVPNGLREAALAVGASQAQTIWSVVLPAARSGILTGVMLAISRIAGETAPLLFTAFGSRLVNWNPSRPVESLTMQIYDYSLQPYDDLVQQAWSGALVLLLLVLATNVLAKVIVGRGMVQGYA